MPAIDAAPLASRAIRRDAASVWDKRSASRWIPLVQIAPATGSRSDPDASAPGAMLVDETDDPTQAGYGVTPSAPAVARVYSIDGRDDQRRQEAAEAPPAEPVCPDAGATLAEIEAYLRSYLSFPDEKAFLPLALFALLEQCWYECFDEVPYLLISAATQSSGKTRVLELLLFLAGEQRAVQSSGDITRAALYTEVSTRRRVVLIDEAEGLQRSDSPFRAILNGGYRRGQTVSRKIGKLNVEFEIYAPKVMAQIGDVYSSLRDRCVTIEMYRMGQGPRKGWVRQMAREEGHEIELDIAAVVSARGGDIRRAYLDYDEVYPTMDFLRDRDREIWKPLFSICQVMAPDRMPELEKSAIDIATFKTRPIRRIGELRDQEEKTQRLEYAEHLLCDAVTVLGERERISTADLVAGLRDIPTAPWRAYQGDGITDMSLASMLKPFGLEPKTIRVKPKGQPGATAKGYLRTDLLRVMKRVTP